MRRISHSSQPFTLLALPPTAPCPTKHSLWPSHRLAPHPNTGLVHRDLLVPHYPKETGVAKTPCRAGCVGRDSAGSGDYVAALPRAAGDMAESWAPRPPCPVCPAAVFPGSEDSFHSALGPGSQIRLKWVVKTLACCLFCHYKAEIRLFGHLSFVSSPEHV